MQICLCYAPQLFKTLLETKNDLFLYSYSLCRVKKKRSFILHNNLPACFPSFTKVLLSSPLSIKKKKTKKLFPSCLSGTKVSSHSSGCGHASLPVGWVCSMRFKNDPALHLSEPNALLLSSQAGGAASHEIRRRTQNGHPPVPFSCPAHRQAPTQRGETQMLPVASQEIWGKADSPFIFVSGGGGGISKDI